MNAPWLEFYPTPESRKGQESVGAKLGMLRYPGMMSPDRFLAKLFVAWFEANDKVERANGNLVWLRDDGSRR